MNDPASQGVKGVGQSQMRFWRCFAGSAPYASPPPKRSYGEVDGQEVRSVCTTHPTSEDQVMKLDRTDAPTSEEYSTVHVAFELSKAKWKLGVMVPGSEKLSRYTIDGGDLAALSARLAAARTKAERCGKPV